MRDHGTGRGDRGGAAARGSSGRVGAARLVGSERQALDAAVEEVEESEAGRQVKEQQAAQPRRDPWARHMLWCDKTTAGPGTQTVPARRAVHRVVSPLVGEKWHSWSDALRVRLFRCRGQTLPSRRAATHGSVGHARRPGEGHTLHLASAGLRLLRPGDEAGGTQPSWAACSPRTRRSSPSHCSSSDGGARVSREPP